MIIKKSNFWAVSVLFLGFGIFSLQGMEKGDPSIPPADGTCYWDRLPYELQADIVRKAGILREYGLKKETVVSEMGENDFISLSPSGKEYVVNRERYDSGWNNEIAIFDSDTGVEQEKLRIRNADCTHMVWAPSGRELAVAWEGGPLTIFERNIAEKTLKEKCSRKYAFLFDVPIRNMAWSPDSKEIIFESGDEIYLSDTELHSDRRRQLTSKEGQIFAIAKMAYSPEGKILVLSHDENGHFFDRETLTLTDSGQLKLPSRVSSVCCMNGYVLCGLWNGAVAIFDILSGRLIQTLSEHKERVDSIIYTPEGDIMSASRDGRICTWHTITPSKRSFTITIQDKEGTKCTEYTRCINLIKYWGLQYNLAQAKKEGIKYVATPEEVVYFSLMSDEMKKEYAPHIAIMKK